MAEIWKGTRSYIPSCAASPRRATTIALVVASALLAASPAFAGSAATHDEAEAVQIPPSVNPELARQSIARYTSESVAPDSVGTGYYPAIKHEVTTLPNHVVYERRDLTALKGAKLPIYLFGNGACSDDGSSQRQHLLEIASHGYLVIASGKIYSGSGKRLTAHDWALHRDRTSYRLIADAIDWAISENSRPGSPYFGLLDTQRIAVSGYSCGGVQALRYVVDSRVTTFVIMNAGLSVQTNNRTGEMDLSPEALDLIRVPTLYVLGGRRDVAYDAGVADYRRLTQVPAALISIDVTHQGTFSQPNGGAAAQAVVAWLDWHLRGDTAAAAWFVGPDCVLCTDPAWTIERRNLPSGNRAPSPPAGG